MLDDLNNINPAIQITMETSDTELFMDIYSKPTDSKRYCLKNFPLSIARGTCMITEKDPLKEIKLKGLETLLLHQHYPERIKKEV